MMVSASWHRASTLQHTPPLSLYCATCRPSSRQSTANSRRLPCHQHRSSKQKNGAWGVSGWGRNAKTWTDETRLEFGVRCFVFFNVENGLRRRRTKKKRYFYSKGRGGQQVEVKTKTVASSVAGDCRFPVVSNTWFLYRFPPHSCIYLPISTHTFPVAWRN